LDKFNSGQLATDDNYSFYETLPQQKEWQRFVRVFSKRKLVLFGLFIITLLIITAIIAPVLAPYNPNAQNLSQTLQAPSRDYWLGTDHLGRDQASRLIFGTRVALQVGFFSVGLASIIGLTLGLISAYYGGWLDNIIMRFIDAVMAIPFLVLALVIAAVLGGGLTNVIISLGIALVPTYCRLMRSQVLSVIQSDYFISARVIGASTGRIMFVHIVPNCLPPIIVLITLNLGLAILAEAALSFLGIGIVPPTPAWGAMINTGYHYLLTHPLLSFAPGVCILLVVLAFNMIGDGLRDALDPSLRGTL
jgi:peptide/nickel transport system permease protein